MSDAIRAAAEQEFRKSLRLTDRWTPLRDDPYQQAFYWHPAPIKVNPSGRRSGKTELSKRKIAPKLTRRRKWPAKIAYGAPTHDQAKAIFWDDLKLLIPKHWVARINESSLTITTTWGAMVKVAGLDRPQRIEGVPWDWFCIDELADCPANLFSLNIQPALATFGRSIEADLIGVPDEVGRNQAEYEQLFEIGLNWPNVDPAICSFHWGSDRILEPEKLAALRSRMSRQQFNQEFRGMFVRSGGKALPDFDTRVGGRHVQPTRYDPALPLDWSLDFGVTPAASLICQVFKNEIRVLAEIVLNDGSVPAAVAAFRETCARNGYGLSRVRIFGDAAGRNRHSNIGASDYEILEQFMQGIPVEFLNLEANPLVKDSLNAVRMAALNADGLSRLRIDPSCEQLISDCKTAPWPDKDMLRKYHTLAALRYYAYRLYEGMIRYDVSRLVLPNLSGIGQRTSGVPRWPR